MHPRRRLSLSLCALLVGTGGCGSSTDSADGGDAGGSPGDDAGGLDGTTPDGGGATPEASASDGGGGDAGVDAASGVDAGCDEGDGGPGTFSCAGSLAVGRDAPGGAVLPGGKVLIAGGWNATSQTLTSAELYDPATSTFAPTGGMANGHLWSGWTAPWPVVGGKVLAAGGLDATGALVATAELYDPAAGTFSSTGVMVPPVVAYAPVTLLDGSALFVGGYSTVNVTAPTPSFTYTTATNQAQRYVASSGSFAAAGTLAEPRLFGCNVVLSSGRVLAIGGWTGAPAASESNIEQYDPGTNAWTTLGTLPAGITCGTRAFVLPSGKVLLDSSYLFDPVALTAAATTNALTGASAIFVQLANGDVLAAGGQVSGTDTAAVATAQVYHDGTGLWTAVGPMHQARAGGRGFLLPSGEVLLVGGVDASNSLVTMAEIYHP